MIEKSTTADHDIKPLAKLEKLAWAMDSKWRLPVLNIPIGWDGILGLVPLLGDVFDIGWKVNTKNVVLIRKHIVKCR